MSAARPRSDYEVAGGEAKIRTVLQKLYDRLFEDPIVGFLFSGKDKQHIVDRQVELTGSLLGGPQRYEGLPLPEAHAALPLLPGHFDRRHFLLAQVLAEENVPESARRAWLEADLRLRSSVLAAGDAARSKTHEPG